ncbi:MAG TPA: methyltransferase [Sphingomicrobium sp.]|nr:methyltransferase [Sphingomicrobium sp.]
MRKFVLGLAVAAAIGLPAISLAASPADVSAAVASPSRSADNVKLDESRKPAEVLSFLGLGEGMHVLDLFGGNRYWAEIMAPAVGATGSVVVWEPSQFANDKTKTEFAAFASSQPNAALIITPIEAPSLGANAYDFVMLNLNYHDTYWQSAKFGIPRVEPDEWLKVVYAAVKPGGIVGVIDHVANPNDDTRVTVEKYHRIDPAVVKADFERAGFVLDGQSDLLRNPADDHSKGVFDPAIRGKTDRFIFRFRKPA